MIYQDIKLRADTEAELKAALPWALAQQDVPDGPQAGGWITDAPHLYTLDLIGPLTLKEAVMGEPDPVTGEAEELEPAEIDDGFHGNLLLVGDYSPDIPEAVIVHPSAPRRVFALE